MNQDSRCRMLRYCHKTGPQFPSIGWNRIGRLALLLAFCLSFLSGSRADAVEATTREEAIASFPTDTPVQTVEEGFFLMGTARSGDTTFSLGLQYDDTEQPQRRIWLPRFEIDRYEVSLGAYLRWLLRTQRPVPEELRKLVEHLMRVHAIAAETLAR